MADLITLQAKITELFSKWIQTTKIALDELTVAVLPEHLISFCLALRDNAELDFALFIDLCGVDYLQYGIAEWETQSATATGFSRGVESQTTSKNSPRFAVIYHLLSLKQNHRIRLRVLLSDESPIVDSVISIWPAANWYEREAFDLFGIIFRNHPDLRRILTDYGFKGHPFRKDFPLSGEVEVRYDAKTGRVIYEPVSIEPRILEPKVIRHDNRYEVEK